jgi:hypothetical protein
MLTQPHVNTGIEKVLYRYQASQIQGEYYDVKLDLKEYRIVKETPKGFWIWIGWGLYENYLPNPYTTRPIDIEHNKQRLKEGLKWVSNDCRKRFAYPTKAEAMVNFKKRKERHIKILRSQLSRAEDALRAINMVINPNIVNFIKAETK